MTKEEFKTKVSCLSDEALKIDGISEILDEAEKAFNRADLSSTTRRALEIGYIRLLNEAYDRIQFLWLHIYNLKTELEKKEDATNVDAEV